MIVGPNEKRRKLLFVANQYTFIMDKFISNSLGSEEPISVQVINDVLNARTIMRSLVVLQAEYDKWHEHNAQPGLPKYEQAWNLQLLRNRIRELSSMLHKHIVGWS